MTQTPSQFGSGPLLRPLPEEGHDPATQELANALGKSFHILKMLMLVLVVLYFLSGWFSVRPNEVGLVERYGRIVGVGPRGESGEAVLGPGWHWSWPYPFERWQTISVNEREIPVEFMFQLSDEEKTAGISAPRFGTLSPSRDDYLITGDVNILHAALTVKYRISDPVAYAANVLPMPDPGANERSPRFRRYPEYSILSALVRDAVIETAAMQEALNIRGNKQDEFLLAVAGQLNRKLKALTEAGAPLGISVDPNTGVLAPKTSTVEGILAPRQVQEAFEGVDKAQSTKSIAITKAMSEAQEQLLNTAGIDYQVLADAVEREVDLMRRLSAISGDSKPRGSPDVRKLEDDLAKQRSQSEKLLRSASGDVQQIISDAQIRSDQQLKEAAGDYQQFISLLPEYLAHPDIFIRRLRDETYADALDNKEVTKMFVSKTSGGRIWLNIPRSSEAAETEAEKGAKKEEKPKSWKRSRPSPVMPK